MTIPVAVLDCMIYLQAAARRYGPARACLDMARQGRLTVCLSQAVRTEVAAVLSRPKVRHKFPALTPEAVAEFLRDIDGLARLVMPVPEVVSLPRDPKDEPYLNLAIAAEATHLITWDNDLLDLMSQNEDGDEFRARFPQIIILTPAAFLREQHQAPAE